jgi:hypothetical protein
MPSGDYLNASARLAGCRCVGDRFEAAVYHLEDSDAFLTINRHAKARRGDWVVIRWTNAEIVLEPFSGQPYRGVACFLEFYQLVQSEQWRFGAEMHCSEYGD